MFVAALFYFEEKDMSKLLEKLKAPVGDPSNPNRIGIPESSMYMLGEIGNMFVLTFVTSFLKYYYTDILGISAAALSVLFFVVRLFDAINDPVWGLIVDRHKPNDKGKFRPYLKWVCIPLSVSMVLCFLPITKMGVPKGGGIALVFAYVTYTAFGMMYTGMNIPFGSLASVVTDDSEGRTLLSTFRSIGGGIGGAPITIILPMLLFTKATATSEKQLKWDATFLAAAIMGALAIAAYMACYKGVRERIPSPENAPKSDFKTTYGSMFKSRAFLSMMFASIFISGMLEYESMFTYMYKSYFVSSGAIYISLQTIARYLPLAVMIFFVGKLSKKFGKKEISTVGCAISSIASISLFIYHPSPDKPYMFLLFSFFVGVGLSTSSLIIWAMVMDVIDYQEYKTHRRNESAIYAIITFARKLGQTFAASGTMMLLDWAGYNSTASIQAAGVGDKILTAATLVPAIAYSVTFLIFAFWYPLNKKKLEKLHEDLKEVRKEEFEEIEEIEQKANA